jgi:NADPH:quinone reductase-like Zn-dependent oxidoreductase
LRATRIGRKVAPEALERREVPVLVPGRDGVLVEVPGAGADFVDICTRQGE